jgi:hypothetical protein
VAAVSRWSWGLIPLWEQSVAGAVWNKTASGGLLFGMLCVTEEKHGRDGVDNTILFIVWANLHGGFMWGQ